MGLEMMLNHFKQIYLDIFDMEDWEYLIGKGIFF